MARKRSPFVQRLISLSAILLFCLVGMLPLRFVRLLSRLLTHIVYFIPRVHRVGMANLNLAYGDTLTPAEKRRILWNSTHNLVCVGLEFPWIARLTEERFRDEVEIRGLDNIDKSQGAILIGGHIGNWEWMPPAMTFRGFSVCIVVRHLDDPYLDAFVEKVRSKCGVEVLSKEGAGREVITRLREGKFVGIAVDQSPRQNGLPVHFYGQPCWGTIGPAMLAARTHVPIYPIDIARKPDNTYILEILPAVEMARTGNIRADLIENTQRCQDAVEEIIRQKPDQWLWAHRRWKERPGLEREWQRIAARMETSKQETTEVENTADLEI